MIGETLRYMDRQLLRKQLICSKEAARSRDGIISKIAWA
jgi:hypothetical protein